MKKWTDKVDKTDGRKEEKGKEKEKEKEKGGKPFVAEVARIVTVNRNYGPVITAAYAGRYFPQKHTSLYTI